MPTEQRRRRATLLGALCVCLCDAAPEIKALVRDPARGRRSRLLIAATSVVVLTVFGAALAHDYHSNPWLLTWIASSCCVTNDCCWEVSESELRSLPNDNWEVISTGQVLKRTDWSADGKFYRCACDHDRTAGQWIRHQGANTRCIFVPMRTAAL